MTSQHIALIGAFALATATPAVICAGILKIAGDENFIKAFWYVWLAAAFLLGATFAIIELLKFGGVA